MKKEDQIDLAWFLVGINLVFEALTAGLFIHFQNFYRDIVWALPLMTLFAFNGLYTLSKIKALTK